MSLTHFFFFLQSYRDSTDVYISEGEDYPQGSCLENELKSPNDDENITKENKVNSNTTTEESLMYTSTERTMRMKEKIKKFMIKTSRGNIKIKTVNIC